MLKVFEAAFALAGFPIACAVASLFSKEWQEAVMNAMVFVQFICLFRTFNRIHKLELK